MKLSRSDQSRWSAPTAAMFLTLAAVLTVGALVARTHPMVWPIIFGVAVVFLLGANRGLHGSGSSRTLPALPALLAERVHSLGLALADSSRRAQLDRLTRLTEITLAAPATGFDEPSNATFNAQVVNLLDACCDALEELARIERVSTIAGLRATSTHRAMMDEAREAHVRRLQDAEEILLSMSISAAQQDQTAAERIADLVSQIRSEIRAREAALLVVDRILSAG